MMVHPHPFVARLALFTTAAAAVAAIATASPAVTDPLRPAVLPNDNRTSQAHPMHLHGFYFEVDSLGDGLRDQPVQASDRHSVVTQLLPPGGTMAMTWTPEREGNWLFTVTSCTTCPRNGGWRSRQVRTDMDTRVTTTREAWPG